MDKVRLAYPKLNEDEHEAEAEKLQRSMRRGLVA